MDPPILGEGPGFFILGSLSSCYLPQTRIRHILLSVT